MIQAAILPPSSSSMWARMISSNEASALKPSATALGFKAESSFDEIIRAHIDDELGGKVAA